MVIPTKSGSCRCSKRKRGRRGKPSSPPLCCLPFYSLAWYGTFFHCVCVFLHFALDMSLCVCQKKEPKDTDGAWAAFVSACLCLCFSLSLSLPVCVCLQLTYGFFSVFGFVNFTWNILLELSYIVACPNLPAWLPGNDCTCPNSHSGCRWWIRYMTPPLSSLFTSSPFHSSCALLHTHKQTKQKSSSL